MSEQEQYLQKYVDNIHASLVLISGEASRLEAHVASLQAQAAKVAPQAKESDRLAERISNQKAELVKVESDLAGVRKAYDSFKALVK